MIFGIDKVTASLYLKLFMKKEIAQQISNSHLDILREISKWPSLGEQIDGKDSPGQHPALSGPSTASRLAGLALAPAQYSLVLGLVL